MRRFPVVTALALTWALLAASLAGAQDHAEYRPFLPGPIWVYNNWSAYDELSDNVPLTEAAAMRELHEVLRLRRLGVHIDYYVMDAFWYDPDGGYRKWRGEGWPVGPLRWIEALARNGILPGLWFSTNTLTHMNPPPQWRDSLTANGKGMALYKGGFLADFMDVLQYWYDRGVRLFKFDFADFSAAAAGDENALGPADIKARNVDALRNVLRRFRGRNPDAVLVAFNGFGGNFASTAAPIPFHNPLDLQWLDAFDTVYAGDPRASDVPEMDFWRSLDIYSDHSVRRFAENGVPLRRIDSTSFMIGDTGTNYHRRTDGWKGMLLLEMARGGWVNTVHGNLELLDDNEARWFARAQRLYEPLQQAGTISMFGGVPGAAEAYGFASDRSDRGLYAVVNPGQSVQVLNLPPRNRESEPHGAGRVLFRDAGFEPVLGNDRIKLGPGQFALIGFGRYAHAAYDLGIQSDIRIPRSIESVSVRFRDARAKNTIETTLEPPASGDLRIVMQQRDLGGAIQRSVTHEKMGAFFVIAASQDGKQLPIEIRYDRVVWSGLSWAVGEIHRDKIAPKKTIRLRLSSADSDRVHLEGHVYRVEY